MVRTSVLIPSRNERFLPQTIDDLCEKGTDIEVIAVLDGYWPERISEDKRVHYLHWSKPRGMRAALNAGVALARGEFVMKLDGHCMFSEGFDAVLADVCKEDWVCIPTRHRLDPENWSINDGTRPPINYLRLDHRNRGMNFVEWREKNRDKTLERERISDIITCQGSCYFMRKDYWHELELLDEENYGTFRKDPQEVTFKAWLSGGRVVRVKDCWYAHLHKGKKYGRGYSGNKRDWDKGDEYVKKWYTNEAWDKATKPWAWLMQKFSDMPGFEREEREIPETPATPEVGFAQRIDTLPRLYQVLKVNGRHFSRPRFDREKSRFWNEGKWRTFVEPLLPEDCRDHTFVEMGADAGLFLKLARDRGYRHVVGVEKNKTPVRWGLKWRDAVGGDWRLLKRKLGGSFGEDGSFDIDELPVADVTLLSTFHYYIDINAWVKYVDRLAAKTCAVLLVSRPELDNGHWMAQADYSSVMDYFTGWHLEDDCIQGIITDGDPAPRELYSVLLRSPLIRRVRIADIDVHESEDDSMRRSMMDLAGKVATGMEFDPMNTSYAERWCERKHGEWSEKTLRLFVNMKADVMRGVRDEGQRDPIIVRNMRLSDGGHRLVMLEALGYETAIVRQI